MPSDLFVTSSKSPTPGNAVAALIVTDDSRYVMQLRDELPGIFYPGHWGCFGGTIEPDEAPLDALRRELFEELELRFDVATRFTRFDFDFSPIGHGMIGRTYFEVRIAASVLGDLRLHEGQAVRAFRGVDLLAKERVSPYDAFAIWMHIRRLQ